MFTTSAAEKRRKLRDDLKNQMEVVPGLWPKAIENVVNEIDRRFDELEEYISDLKKLEGINSRQY
jgi:hypothetical protein